MPVRAVPAADVVLVRQHFRDDRVVPALRGTPNHVIDLGCALETDGKRVGPEAAELRRAVRRDESHRVRHHQGRIRIVGERDGTGGPGVELVEPEDVPLAAVGLLIHAYRGRAAHVPDCVRRVVGPVRSRRIPHRHLPHAGERQVRPPFKGGRSTAGRGVLVVRPVLVGGRRGRRPGPRVRRVRRVGIVHDHRGRTAGRTTADENARHPGNDSHVQSPYHRVLLSGSSVGCEKTGFGSAGPATGGFAVGLPTKSR